MISLCLGDCVVLGHVYLGEAKAGEVVKCARCGKEFVFEQVS